MPFANQLQLHCFNPTLTFRDAMSKVTKVKSLCVKHDHATWISNTVIP